VEQIPDVGPSRVPASVYTDPERFELERTRVLRDSWFMIGRSAELADPGDYLVWEEFGETVVVSRLEDGGLAAFHNVCQHRGARIAPSSGRCERHLVCPWHGWLFELDGQVAGVPDRADFDDAEIKGLRAPPVAVADWGGWIWIHLAGPDVAPPLLEDLGEIAEELAPYRMEEMELHATATWEMPVNWKAVVDAFIEVYHVAETHRVTIGEALAVRETAITLFDRHSMYVVPYSFNLETLQKTQDHQRYANTHYHVYPFSIFNCQTTHIQAFTPIPTGPNTTKFVAWNLIQPGGDRRFRTEMDRAWDLFTRVAAEDLYVAEQAGATRRSMGYTRNLNNERECRITHFLSVLDKQIAG
jgi:phenylpropionate dioxygenase-like ring-hydroxylating dioxygenase large terminal subunit